MEITMKNYFLSITLLSRISQWFIIFLCAKYHYEDCTERHGTVVVCNLLIFVQHTYNNNKFAIELVYITTILYFNCNIMVLQ